MIAPWPTGPTRGNQNPLTSGKTVTLCALHSAKKVLNYVTDNDRGRKTDPKAGDPTPGISETFSCASTSVPTDPAQAYWEKNGRVKSVCEDL